MNSVRILSRISIVLGVIALLGMAVSILAFADIHQNNEPNLDAEWKVVMISFLLNLIFIIVSLVTIIVSQRKNKVAK